jgi:2-oxoisovalerate dehydrogenase E1 component
MSLNQAVYRDALLIRRVEETFLELFSQGKMNGTVHTCVGQEFVALAFAGQLQKGDTVSSNHRCHGHYIAFTGDWQGLMAELMGKETGVSGGIGSSQHLCRDNFFSNGIQGGMVPVAAGMALARQLDGPTGIGVVFIGDGTLGQGVVYETMNLASLLRIPLLIVCENNFYAQSTPQQINLAGDILQRAEAFGLASRKSDTWNPEELFAAAASSIDYVRTHQAPLFHLVDTYRLNPHSKGDDNRSPEEIRTYREKDPLHLFARQEPDIHQIFLQEINGRIAQVLGELETQGEMAAWEYHSSGSVEEPYTWAATETIEARMVERIHHFFAETMALDKDVLFIGEDVLSPYGGAFKVSRDLSEKYPAQVIGTPISEAAITGLANGLALAGKRPFLEIMFGDFVTLCMDQIINHASKFHHMYNKQVACPIVIRTPMGGRRGYGPTHSQTLDKLLVGIANVTTIALNTLLDPLKIYQRIYTRERHAVIVIENKSDYPSRIGRQSLPNYTFEQSSHDYPVVRIRPSLSTPDVTLVTYGGMAGVVLDAVMEIFFELDLKPEVLVLSKIHPLDCQPILDSVAVTGKLVVAEEGSAFAGIGSEIIASVAAQATAPLAVGRIAAQPVPIPSCKTLESFVLPGKETIIETIGRMFDGLPSGNLRAAGESY